MSDRPGDLSSDKTDSAPAIDYLSKDFASFRRLMLDRLASVAPNAATGNAADAGTVLAELLAYAADQVSYYQDAVATEAYLGTARLRTSVRRHARLLDYPMHDGCNARAWVAITVLGTADGRLLPSGTQLLTRVDGQPAILMSSDVVPARAQGAQVFETMHDLLLRSAHNRIALQPSGNETSLAIGATSATLLSDSDPNKALALRVGDVLVFEEVSATAVGATTTGDPQHRHAVRLTEVQAGTDGNQPVVKVSWDAVDALPIALPLATSSAVGNVVLADHGYSLPTAETIAVDPDAGVPGSRRLQRPLLSYGPLTWQAMVVATGQPQPFSSSAAASAAFPSVLDPGTVVQPCISLTDDKGRPWTARRDLLGSDGYARDFVVECEDDGRTYLRFGDDTFGKQPRGDLLGTYRVGNGRVGNVGAEAIFHIVSDLPGLRWARNPLPGQGGVDPQSIDEVRLQAPQAFRSQQRAVTPDDYAALALRYPGVLDCRVVHRYCGSAFTHIVTVLRTEGDEVDASFQSEVTAYLERYRMAGHALSVNGPTPIPLDVQLAVEVETGHSAMAVLAALQAALNPVEQNGKRGFFHPDNFLMGQPVYLSELVSAAMAVKGVSWIDVRRFRRYGGPGPDVCEVLTMRPTEVASLRNISDTPERGKLEFIIGGGQ